jgi:hypothetical protein
LPTPILASEVNRDANRLTTIRLFRILLPIVRTMDGVHDSVDAPTLLSDVYGA